MVLKADAKDKVLSELLALVDAILGVGEGKFGHYRAWDPD
jgi:hypothetical protein